MKFGSRFDAWLTIFVVVDAAITLTGLFVLVGLGVFDPDPMGNNPTLTRVALVAFLGGVGVLLAFGLLVLVLAAAAAIYDAASYLRRGDG